MKSTLTDRIIRRHRAAVRFDTIFVATIGIITSAMLQIAM